MSVQNFSGLGSSDRNSSKVMAPPGGRTSINLFGASEPEPTPKQAARQQQSSNIFGAPEPAPAPRPRHETSHNNIFGNGPAPASPQKPVQRRDPLTGEGIPKEKTARDRAAENPIAPASEPPKMSPGGGKPSTKVMAPPGGKSSITF